MMQLKSWTIAPLLMVFTLAALSLLSFLMLIGIHNLDVMVNFINDSVGHVTTARHIADDHRIEGSLIFLLNLPTHATHLYMPGYHAVLAFMYTFFGYHTFATLLPNVISWIGTSLLIYTLAAK